MLISNDPGLWAERCNAKDFSGKPALFLDRDGVIVEDVHFLRRPEDVRLIDGVGAAIAQANARNIPVIVVTNQSGVAREYFTWKMFEVIQQEIASRLAKNGARVDGVFACGYHEDGKGVLAVKDHPWRKPGPGMLLRAQEVFCIDLAASFIVGDNLSDLEAGHAAGISGGALAPDRFGRRDQRAFETACQRWRASGFRASISDNAAVAISSWLGPAF